MKIDEVKDLLKLYNLKFISEDFKTEKDYASHLALFPYLKNAESCNVTALIIKSNNGKKDIELQFNKKGDNYIFYDVYFGEYPYELFDCQEELLADSIIDTITEIMSGNLICVVKNDLKHKHWIGDCLFSINDEEDKYFGKQAYEALMNKINKPKSIIENLKRTSEQFEIYDWNNYKCIIK